MHRLLTHSSSPRLEECRFFYDHVRNRGYPAKAIAACFREINWNQRRKMLEPKKKAGQDENIFFSQYRRCVFSTRNAPGIHALRQEMDLSLHGLQCHDAERDIFSQRTHFAVKSAMQWDLFYYSDFTCYFNVAAEKSPQNSGYSRPLLGPK